MALLVSEHVSIGDKSPTWQFPHPSPPRDTLASRTDECGNISFSATNTSTCDEPSPPDG